MASISCGVPQGSILGPLLFLIYINDLPNTSDFECVLFADDTNLILSADRKDELIKKCNAELKKISNWFCSNKLTLHPDKTQFCIFNDKDSQSYNKQIDINGTKLGRVGRLEKETAAKFVGVMIDENLNWKEHIQYVTLKVRTNLFFLQQFKKLLPSRVKFCVYNALIKPYLEYACAVWGHKNIGQLFVLQKKL